MNDAPLDITEQTREVFLTSRQLALILQVSERTVQRLARSGRIPVIHLTPRIMRFHLRSVCDVLEAESRPLARRAEDESNEEAQLSFTDLLWHPPTAEEHRAARANQKPRKKTAASLDAKAGRR